MNTPRRLLTLRAFTGITALGGPACAVLYEMGAFRLFTDPLNDIWALVMLAALGSSVGVFGFARGAKIIGAACVLSNGAVLVLYGFIAAFFAFGGSR